MHTFPKSPKGKQSESGPRWGDTTPREHYCSQHTSGSGAKGHQEQLSAHPLVLQTASPGARCATSLPLSCRQEDIFWHPLPARAPFLDKGYHSL